MCTAVVANCDAELMLYLEDSVVTPAARQAPGARRCRSPGLVDLSDLHVDISKVESRCEGKFVSTPTATTAITPPPGATETVMLIRVSAAVNNNKFYELSKMPDGSTLARWGRVGAAKPQSQTYAGHGSFSRKIDEKLGRGYVVFDGGHAHPQRRTGAVADPGHLLQRVTAGLFATGHTASKDLVSELIRHNRHAIDTATGGRITVSESGAVRTALGAVSLAQINTARGELAVLRRGYNSRAVERYLTLIPQPITDVREKHWVTGTWCREQDDLLAALESAVTMATTGDDTDVAAEPIAFRHTLVELGRSDEQFACLAEKFDRSRNTMHDANRLTLHRAWTITDTAADAWDARKAQLKHTRQLWHGTSAGNMLSILRTGLICPPTNAGAYNLTGRMFGDGVYFSDQSTKSLNYAIGRAPGQHGRSAAGNPMMLLADVVMGRECRSDFAATGSALVLRSRTGTDAKGRPFHSLFVRGGHCGVRNNEMVIWNTEQIKLTYLCEFK